jgi:diguanylate cyclase (GGDEF)-like protein
LGISSQSIETRLFGVENPFGGKMRKAPCDENQRGIMLQKKLATTFRALFNVPTDNPGLMQSQLEAFSRQGALLYLIVLVNTATLAFTHYGLAPFSLTIAAPMPLLVICVARLWRWTTAARRLTSDAVARRRLKISVGIAIGLGAFFISWALALFPYGNAYTQGYIAFYIGITLMGCVFCLIHIRPAALLLTGVVIVPYTIFFVSTGNPVFIATALNMLLVSAGMVYILITYSRHFADMVAFQKRLVETHTETQRLSDENLRLANLDSLTDLPNRRQFFARLHDVLRRASSGSERFIVGLIDLDGFKAVNDGYGHAMGDRVLVEAGRRMLAFCDDKTFLARLGGDEFGVIIDAEIDDADIHAFGQQICGALDMPFDLPGAIAQISGSVGFAIFPQAGSSAEQLFERADYALYHAKQHLRGRPVIFSSAQDTGIRNFGNVEQALCQANLEAETSLYFQQIFDFENGEASPLEAA